MSAGRGERASFILRRAGLTGLLTLLLAGNARADEEIQTLRQMRVADQVIAAIQFDHASGTASRVETNTATGDVLERRAFAGRPQSSSWEFQDAVCILAGEATLRGLLAEGAVAEGGFIVDGPSGQPMRHRYIQIRLLSPDRQSLLRVAVVDLTARTVASVRSWFE